MLSLKNNTQHAIGARPAVPANQLDKLPNELLIHVVGLVLRSSDYPTEALCPLTLISSRFRNLVQPLLFESVNVVLSRLVLRREESAIQWLLRMPRIRDFVKIVNLMPPLQPRGHDEKTELEALQELLPLLHNLEILNVHILNTVNIRLLNTLPILRNPVHLAILKCHGQEGLGFSKYHPLGTEALEKLNACRTVSLELTYNQTRYFSRAEAGLMTSQRVKAVRLQDEMVDPNRWTNELGALRTESTVDIKQFPMWSSMEELHMDYTLLLAYQACFSANLLGQELETKLHRLAVHGTAAIFPAFIIQLASLKSLRSLTFRCTYPSEGLTRVPEFPVSPFRRLLQLREVELDQISREIPLEYFTTPSLRKLKLHCADVMFRRLREQQPPRRERNPEEILTLEMLCPHLEHLEMDIGDMSTLWHPTAIPGIDVDLTVYRALNALAKLPNLTHLRLFPAYTRGGSLDWGWPAPPYSQPLSDEQAIKVFHHLCTQSRSLRSLAISADNDFAATSRRFDFHPMSWTMHMNGSKTILVTRQALRHYEQRQVWEGSRRLTTEIKRSAYLKPYIPYSPGWILPSSF